MRNTTTSTKRGVAGIALAAAAALMLAGCTGQGGDSTSGAPEGGGTLVVMGPQESMEDLATNAFTAVVEEKFDIDFEWQTTPFEASAATEARQVALSSGNYPDLFLLVPWIDGFSRAEVMRYGQQGVLVPLEDLITEYAPNIVAAMEQAPEWAEALYAPDGHIYGLAQWSDCYHCSYPSKLWMNTAWLETLGLEQPTTTEEMRTVLTAFKNQDPNGNGLADEIPITSSTVADNPFVAYLMNAFTYAPPTAASAPGPLVLDNGKVAMQAVTDEWREGLSYIASLFEEGLVDDGVFTQDANALNALGNNADAVIVGSAAVLWPGFTDFALEDGRQWDYDAVPPIAGPDGWQTTTKLAPVNPVTSFALTNKSTEDERVKAIKMMDYIFGDGNRQAQLGPEGEGWEPAQPGDIALDPSLEPSFRQLSYTREMNSSWRSMGEYWGSAEFRNSQVFPEDVYTPAGLERRLFQATDEYAPYAPEESIMFPYYALWPNPDTSSELADLQTNIVNYLKQSEAEFITGQRDINDDGAWESYKSDLNGLGLDRFLELWQQMYDDAG